MKKAIVVLMLAAMTATTVIGCGSSSSDTTTDTTATTDTTEDAAAEEETAEEAPAEEEAAEDTEAAGGSMSGAITVLSREDGSGTRGAFIELMGIEQKDADGNKVDMTVDTAEITNSTSVMMTTVAGNTNAIGYVSLGSLDTSMVKALNVDGVEATVDTVKDGSYAVARPFNIATAGEPEGVALHIRQGADPLGGLHPRRCRQSIISGDDPDKGHPDVASLQLAGLCRNYFCGEAASYLLCLCNQPRFGSRRTVELLH